MFKRGQLGYIKKWMYISEFVIYCIFIQSVNENQNKMILSCYLVIQIYVTQLNQ